MGLAAVREARVDDAAVLGGLQLEFWQQAYAALLPATLLERSDADQAQAWRLRLQAGGTALLATEGGAPVGFALLDPEPADGIGEIQALGVLPRWSRRGHPGRAVLLGNARPGAGLIPDPPGRSDQSTRRVMRAPSGRSWTCRAIGPLIRMATVASC